jgi:hypothetical protein
MYDFWYLLTSLLQRESEHDTTNEVMLSRDPPLCQSAGLHRFMALVAILDTLLGWHKTSTPPASGRRRAT